ncbi:unnamed protein product [Musa acuminata var. zebrina]
MTKAIPRIGSRRNERIGSRKIGHRIPKGIIHFQQYHCNCYRCTRSGDFLGLRWYFKGTRRGTPYAAQATTLNAIRTVVNQGMQRAEVMIKSPDLEKDVALRAIRRSGILLSFVCDVTPMPHNGCRPPKKRRV